MSNSVPCSWWGSGGGVSQHVMGVALLDPSLHGLGDSPLLSRGIGLDAKATCERSVGKLP